MQDSIQIDFNIRGISKKGFNVPNNKVTFETIERVLRSGVWTSYFIKRSENKFLIIIPVESELYNFLIFLLSLLS